MGNACKDIIRMVMYIIYGEKSALAEIAFAKFLPEHFLSAVVCAPEGAHILKVRWIAKMFHML